MVENDDSLLIVKVACNDFGIPIFRAKVLELDVIVLAAEINLRDFLIEVHEDDWSVLNAAGKVAFPPQRRDVDDFRLSEGEEERI